MAQGIDGGLWLLIREHMKAPTWQRIESGLTASGIPDLNGCLNGQEIWVELKKVVGRQVKLTPYQVGWLVRRSLAGGRTWILARHQHGGGPRLGSPVDRLLLWRGEHARAVKEKGLEAEALCELILPTPFDWYQLMVTLFGEQQKISQQQIWQSPQS